MKKPFNIMKYKSERKAIARFMKRLYRHGLTTTSGGNISMRVSDNTVLITPSATDKGRMSWREVGILSMEGENLTPVLKLSIESEMHLSIYRKRDVKAIIHAHPVFATSFTAMKRTINTDLTAEACAILGDPAFVPYALMGTEQLAEKVAEQIDNSNILLLENHGILSVGNDLLQAFDRIEVLENAAKMTVITDTMGKASPLTSARKVEIKKLFG
jgi:L-fuculose-phosphate aldolase